MKNRRNIIVAFLLCACLIVGVGYANLTTNLMLKGNAKIDSTLAENVFDAAIIWSGAEVVSSTTGATEKVEATIDASNDTITIVADGLDTKGEIITVTCTMKNKSTDTDATVVIPQTTLNGDASPYISVIRTNYNVEGTVVNPGDTIELGKGESANIVITFELIQEFVPTDTLTTVESRFDLTFLVTAVVPSTNP
jgi:uncharacterized protein with beta-barrel porin domain